MFCPRCGTRNEPGDRFCVSCGASLRAPEGERLSKSERIGRLVGTTRRARLLTAGSIVAIALAIVAFSFLPSDDEIDIDPDDPFTLSADQICVQAKQQIAAAGQRSLNRSGAAARFGSALVPIVAEWRALFDDLDPPADRADRAAELDAALREVLFAAAAMARASRQDEGGEQAVLERAKRADTASTRVEEAITELGLPECDSLAVGLAPPSG